MHDTEGNQIALLSFDSTFLDLLPAAVYVCDATGLIHYCNRQATELWGQTPRYGDPAQRFCGSVQLFSPDGLCLPHAETPMAEALRTGVPQRNKEVSIGRPDGSRITVMANIDVLRDQTGALIGAVNVFQDITDRKRAEQYLATQLSMTQILAAAADFNEAAPRLLQTICEHLDWGVGLFWTVDPQAHVLRCASVWPQPSQQTPAFETVSQQQALPPGVGLPGRVWASGQPHWSPEIVTDTHFPWALMAAGEGFQSGFGFPICLGTEVLGVIEFFSQETCAPNAALLDMMACIGSQIGQFLDRKRSEEALRQSEAHLRAVLDYAPIFLARCDKERRFTFVNQSYAQRFGLRPEDLIGKHVADGLGTEAYESFRQYVDVVLTGQPVEFEVDIPYVRGGRRYMHCAYVPDRSADGEVEGWVAVITDMTARRRTEEQLREQSQIAETLNRIGTTLAAEFDLQKTVQMVTDEATRLTDAEFGAFFYNVLNPQGESYMLYTLSGVQKEAFANFPMPRNTALFGPTFRGEAVVRLDDVRQDPRYGKNAPYYGLPNGHLPVRSYLAAPVLSRSGNVLGGMFFGHSRPAVFTARHERLVSAIAAQAAVAIERTQAEEALRHLNETLAQHVAERTAELTQANIALQAEMLRHKQAREQLERQQETLAHRETLAAMSSMLAGVAHELNNPLAVVIMQADLLLEEASGSPMAAYAREVTEAARRCIDIVNHFLSLARQQSPVRTEMALNTVVEAAMMLFTYPLQVDSITVEYHLAEALPVLWADPHQIEQVIVNLISNAHQALRETAGPRRVAITTRADYDRQCVVLELADTGPGIPPALQQRIFDPFFTTKPVGMGTGLGLSLCLGIVEKHGGTLSVASTPGQGAVFRIELPLEARPGDIAVSPAPAPLSIVEPKTILVIDDEPGITRALAHLLRRDGHLVETVANGRLGLEECQARDYELILCDLRMPELDGPGFYQALECHHPHLCQRIIFLTGDTLSLEAQAFLERTRAPQLNKPFTAAMIRQAIQRLCVSARYRSS